MYPLPKKYTSFSEERFNGRMCQMVFVLVWYRGANAISLSYTVSVMTWPSDAGHNYSAFILVNKCIMTALLWAVKKCPTFQNIFDYVFYLLLRQGFTRNVLVVLHTTITIVYKQQSCRRHRRPAIANTRSVDIIHLRNWLCNLGFVFVF